MPADPQNWFTFMEFQCHHGILQNMHWPIVTFIFRFESEFPKFSNKMPVTLNQITTASVSKTQNTAEKYFAAEVQSMIAEHLIHKNDLRFHTFK